MYFACNIIDVYTFRVQYLSESYHLSVWNVDSSVANRIANDIKPMIMNSRYIFLTSSYRQHVNKSSVCYEQSHHLHTLE